VAKNVVRPKGHELVYLKKERPGGKIQRSLPMSCGGWGFGIEKEFVSIGSDKKVKESGKEKKKLGQPIKVAMTAVLKRGKN